MFGNAPRALWSRWATPDEQGRIPLACRAMLVEEMRPEGTRRILFEAGVGVFFPPKLRARFGVEEDDHRLLVNLARAGLQPEEIDVVVLSHLHFDHAGGLLSAFSEGQPLRLVFPNATFVVSEAAWQRALHPHMRDRASFIPELNTLLEDSGRLVRVDGAQCDELGDGYRLHYSEGHTPGLLLTEIQSEDGPILFAGDLIPGEAWVHAAITMGYDRYPEKLIDEKSELLQALVGRRGRLFFTHDPTVALARIGQSEKNRFIVIEKWHDAWEFSI